MAHDEANHDTTKELLHKIVGLLNSAFHEERYNAKNNSIYYGQDMVLDGDE